VPERKFGELGLWGMGPFVHGGHSSFVGGQSPPHPTAGSGPKAVRFNILLDTLYL